MQRRNTIQKQMVLNAVRALQKHATAEEVYEWIRREHPSIGKGTVYRNLNILDEEGSVLKIEVAGGPDRFDHTCHRHFHLKCIRCGDVDDIDLHEFPNLMNRIRDSRGAKVLGCDIMFKGICRSCQEHPNEKEQSSQS